MTEAIEVEVGGFRCVYRPPDAERLRGEPLGMAVVRVLGASGELLYSIHRVSDNEFRMAYPRCCAFFWERSGAPYFDRSFLDRMGRRVNHKKGPAGEPEFAWLLDLANEAAVLATGRPLIPED